jgi:hypothetical protein
MDFKSFRFVSAESKGVTDTKFVSVYSKGFTKIVCNGGSGIEFE